MNPVTFDSSCYRIDGRSIHLHSGEFHYFRVPKADWRRRMELFKEAGGNCLATYIPWLIHEPDEGRFVFGGEDGITDLEGFLRLAAEVGLYVIAKPGPHQYSELRYGGLASWLIPNHPGLRAKTLDGKDLGRGSVSYVHPLFLEKARNWFAKVCPLIARHQVERGGAVAFLQLDNELTGIHFWNGGPDYNAEAMGFGRKDGRFARFLERRYGDVRQLNESWGTDFEELADARPVAIEPTRDLRRLRAMKDYIEFYLDTISEYVSTLASWAREFGITVPLMHNSANQPMNPLFLETVEAMRGKGETFLLGADHYYHGRGQFPVPKYAVSCFCSLEMLRLMGCPPTVMELPSGAWQDWPPPGAEAHRAAYLLNLAYGMKGSNYYIFTGGPNPPDAGSTDEIYDYNAPIGAQNQIRPLYYIQKEFGKLLADAPWLADAERECDCRFALDWDMTRAEYYWKDAGAAEFSPLRAWELLRHGGLLSAFCASLSPAFCDLGRDDWTSDLSTPVLVVASSCMSRDKQERVIRFLNAGGKALILPVLPTLDENLRPCDALLRFLGSPRFRQDAAQPFGRLAMADVILNCKGDALFFSENLPPRAQVVGRDTVSDRTAAWRLDFEGGGAALVLGLNWSHHKHEHWRLLLQALTSLGLRRKIVCSNPNVWTSLRTADGRSMLFLINLFTSPLDADVTVHPRFLTHPVTAGHHRLEPLTIEAVPFASVDGPAPPESDAVKRVSGPAQGRPAIIEVDLGRREPLQLRFGYNNNVFGLPMRFNDPRFVEAIRDSGASLMRFPGGTIANFYDWRRDDFLSDTLKTLDPALEVRRENYATEEEYRVWVDRLREYVTRYITQIEHTRAVRGRYGYDDFRQLADQAGAEIVYVANVNIAPDRRDPAAYVAEWMENLKRQGIAVGYLELGNEITEGVQGLLNNLIDPRQYLAVCERAARRIKRVFPDIKIGIVAEGLGNRTTQDGASKRDRANHDLMRVHATNDFFDAIISHSYLGLREHVDYGLTEKAAKLFAYAETCPRDSWTYWKERFPGKEIWMTEIGYFSNKSDRQEFVAALFNALYENDYLLHWLDCDDVVKMYLKHVAYAPTHGGKSVLFGGEGEAGPLFRHAHYHGFALVGGALKAASHKLGVRVYDDDHIDAEISMYVGEKDDRGLTSPGRGETRNRQVSVDRPTARALLSRDGAAVLVPFVNKGAAPKDVRIVMPDAFPSDRTVEVQSVSGDLTDKNTAEHPQRVAPSSFQAPAGGLIALPGYSTGVIRVPLIRFTQEKAP